MNHIHKIFCFVLQLGLSNTQCGGLVAFNPPRWTNSDTVTDSLWLCSTWALLSPCKEQMIPSYFDELYVDWVFKVGGLLLSFSVVFCNHLNIKQHQTELCTGFYPLWSWMMNKLMITKYNWFAKLLEYHSMSIRYAIRYTITQVAFCFDHSGSMTSFYCSFANICLLM